jgi:benzoyl-CoA reductase/2-hydroxyglutaryl-CoA dehydratase subunit BcrC/BadD/HgdB
MPTVVCPFLRSCLDLGLKGAYDFLDGFVTSHICDVGAGMHTLWNATVATPFSYQIDTPHTTRGAAREHMRGLLQGFAQALEELTERPLTADALAAAVASHNRQRALVRELYQLKKADPPLLSGAETLLTLKAVHSLPVDEGSELVEEVIAEARQRPDLPPRTSKRLLLWGSVLDDTALLDMIESLDATVVMDDICVGSRAFFDDVAETSDPVDGLARHYLENIRCPRTFRAADSRATTKDYGADLESRFSYLAGYVRDWKVHGVIAQSVRYCDTHGYEVVAVRDYLDGLGLPSLYLEHDYTRGALAPLRTRVQGFLEILG